MLPQGEEAGLAKESRAGYRRKEERKGKHRSSEVDGAKVLFLAPGFCLPPSLELAYCKWGFPFGIFTPETPRSSQIPANMGSAASLYWSKDTSS